VSEPAVPNAEVTILDIEEPRPGAVVNPGAQIPGRGWLVSDAEIDSVRLYIGDQFCGFATYGAFRPDVLERFPGFAQADQSGIVFVLQAPAAAQEADLVVVATTRSGRETRRVVPLHIGAPAAAPQAAPASDAALWPIRMFIEQARLDAAGLLRVRGWIASRTPVESLQLRAGDIALGVPELGLPRPDIAILHPEYPNAPMAGFRLVEHVAAPGGEQLLLHVQAITSDGARRHLIMPVDRPSQSAGVEGGASESPFCCDVASVDAEGQVILSGWAISADGIVSIGVEHAGQPVGEANIGLARPDVGNRYPRIPGSRNSGFHFSYDMERPPESGETITLRVRHGEGAEQAYDIPLQLRTGVWAEQAPGLAASIRFNIDEPVLQGDHARDVVGAMFTVTGWAIAPGGIDTVEVTIDDRIPARAYYGARREDIAAALPELPDSLLSGFTLHAGTLGLAAGEHTVRVQVRSKDGDTQSRAFAITCGEIAAPWELTRPKLGQAEIDFGSAILDRSTHCTFQIHICLPDATSQAFARARATADSLRAQAYRHWRAVLCAPQPLPAPQRRELGPLEGGADRSKDSGRDISRAFVCCLHAGDVLGADALLEFAVHAVLHPDDDFIYADERRRSPIDGHAAAFFKPGWSPDLLLSSNYIGRAWCATRAVIRTARIAAADFASIGGYAIALRLTENAGNIGHIPRLLLDTTGAPRHATDRADRSALAEAVTRRGLRATLAAGRAPGTFRLRRKITRPGRVSVIIPTVAARGLIETTIQGLRGKTDWPDIEIIVIDNIPAGQGGHWKDWLREHADRVIDMPEAFNWSRFNNVAAASATGDYLLFLNDDIEITQPDWLAILVSHAQRPEVGVVGPQLLYPDGKVQQSGIFLTATGGRHLFRFAAADEPGPFGLAVSEREIIAVTGACMLMRRDAFEQAGGFNESHSIINNDVDYCLRARRAGQAVIFTPHANLIHHELASRAQLPDEYDRGEFQKDWASLLREGDPFFNPNLSQHSDLWSPQPEPIETIFAAHPLVARDRVRRILAIKLDHIGDFVTALPALRRLKQRFPAAELHVLCAAASAIIAELEPSIDFTVQFDFFHARSGKGRRDVARDELLELREKLAPYEFDLAIDLRLQPETRPVLQYTGAKWLAGFIQGDLFAWLDIALPWEGDEKLIPKRHHVSDRLTQLVEAVSVACEPPLRVKLPGTPANARSRMASLRAFAGMPPSFRTGLLICVHPGAGSDTKQWPAAYFATLIDLLIEVHNARIILIGGPDEAPVAADVIARISHPEKVFSVASKAKLADLPVILRACDMFVGNDSGPKHLAAALGVRTLGIHSAVVDAREWGPIGQHVVALRRRVYCGPCYIAAAAQCPRGMACLTGLLPADAYRACERLLHT
jgi:ADP-heptose:LPS heptosyltransferase/GT2 family glycosyltransferase